MCSSLIISRYGQIRGRGSHDANHHRGTKLRGGQLWETKVGSLSRSTKKYTYKLNRLHPTQLALLWQYMFLNLQSYSCKIVSKYSMGTSQVDRVPTFRKACMADVSVSYRILKSEYPKFVQLPVMIGDLLRVSSFKPDISTPEFIEHVTISQSLR